MIRLIKQLEKKDTSIRETIIAGALLSATGFFGGYFTRDFARELGLKPSTPPAHQSGLGELQLPTSHFPSNLNAILEEYPSVSVQSIHPGHPHTTIRFRE